MAKFIFLSYARGDDEPFVRLLYEDLKTAGFTVWFDRESLLASGVPFLQEIKGSICNGLDRLIYVAGPKAAVSDYVRVEWQFALQCDNVVVTPILRQGDYDLLPFELSQSHCEDFRKEVPYDKALAKLIASLELPNPKLGALLGVPTLPPRFISRPDLARRIQDALMVDLQKPQIVTRTEACVGVQGMGGIGKSVLAAAMVRDRDIRQSYPDGVIWVSCGQDLSNDDLMLRQKDVAAQLGGREPFNSIAQGLGVLRELFSSKAVLLVFDDVWSAGDLQPFDVLGPRCRMLVTTRDAGILHALNGQLVPVSLFTEKESVSLLSGIVGMSPDNLPSEAHEVVRECGNLPLALALSGGMAKKRGGTFHSVLERLRHADLEKIFDRVSMNKQHESIWRAMQAGVNMLSDDEQKRFIELVVFCTDHSFPEAAVATLWAHTGHLNELDTEELLISFHERSLVRLERNMGEDGQSSSRVSLHDLLYDYVFRVTGDLRPMHQILLDSYAKKCSNGWSSGPNDGYFFQNICSHAIGAAALSELAEIVNTFAFLKELAIVQVRDRGSYYSYPMGADILRYLSPCLEKLKASKSSRSIRLLALSEDAKQFAAALEFGKFSEPDLLAKCPVCGSFGVIHSYEDLGGVMEIADNYCALCPMCYWGYHFEERTSDWGPIDPVREFDYESSRFIVRNATSESNL